MQTGLDFFRREGKRFLIFGDGGTEVAGCLEGLAAEVVTGPACGIALLGAF
jgi:hypothetical protein